MLAALLSPAAYAAGAKAGDICEPRGIFTPNEGEKIRRWVATSVPVPDVEAARRLVIDIDKSLLLGPEIDVRNGIPHVIVSGPMRRLHCRLVVAGYVKSLDLLPASAFKAATLPIRRCIEEGGDVVPCVATALDQLWPDAAAAIDKLDGLNRTALDLTIDNAFLALIVHEFGHYSLGHSPDHDDFDVLAKQELDADMYSLMAGSALDYVSLSQMYNFAFLGTADALPKFDSPHASFSCRLMLTTQIGGMIGYPARMISQLAQYESVDLRSAVFAASRGKRAFYATPGPECRARSIPGLEAVDADLRSIAQVQVEVEPVNKVPPLRALLGRLIALPLTTPLGKVIRSRVITIYVVRAEWWRKGEDMEWLYAALNPERNKASYLAQDYGMLLGIRGIAMSFLPDANQKAPERHRILALAYYYNPDFTLARAVDGELFANEGKCRRAITLLTPPPPEKLDFRWDPVASLGERGRVTALKEAREKQAGGKCAALSPAPSSAAR